MAWTCSGRTNNDLIDKMRAAGLIQSELVATAMRKVDRKNYVPDAYGAYQDSPQRIGYNATISAPHMHAHALENLIGVFKSSKELDSFRGNVLDVGSGSGYLTAVLHYLLPNAKVIGIDHIQPLVDLSLANLKRDGVEIAQKGLGTEGAIKMICGDGRQGSPEHGPYTIIHVGAAAPTLPQPLVDQLAAPGRMFIPVGESSQDIWQVDKSPKGEVTRKKLFGVMYVPLTDAHAQWNKS